MVGSCIAPGCTNYYSPRRHISYFRFPNPSKYPELHKAWIRAMRNPNFKPSIHSCICELHFNEEDFDETYKMKKALMPSDYFRPILKPNAVPKLEMQGGSAKRNGEREEKVEILRELLGDSYLKWKRTANVVKIEKADEEEEEKVARTEFLKVFKKESRVMVKEEIKVEECQKRNFNITRDFVMKQPLKPLPEELQRIIPSILSVIIKEAPDRSEKSLKIEPKPKQFSCINPLPIKYFHCCQLCDFTTFLKINLLNHTRTAHCPIKTHQIERLPMKIYKHKEPKTYTCNNCNFSTFSKLVLLRHIHKTKEYHLLHQIEVKWFKCDFCAYKSRNNCGLKKHTLIKHPSETEGRKFKCDLCSYSHEKEKNLKRHLMTRHRGYEQTKWFQCRVCPYKSSVASVLEKHTLMMHPERQYKYQCQSCDYSTILDSRMRKHVLARHTPDGEVAWFKCKECHFQTKYKSSYKNHSMKKHGMQVEED